MKIIQIIPAPVGSYIVRGPYEHDDPQTSTFIDPCAFLALVEHPDDERTVEPCDFHDLEPNMYFGNCRIELCVSRRAAEEEKSDRISNALKELLARKASEQPPTIP